MNLVFVYGTLLSNGSNPAKEYAGAKVLGKGWVVGRLYDLGWYPGYKPEADIDSTEISKVFGELIEVDTERLAKLDAYESYPSLYDRQKVWVHTDDDLKEAWIYIYNFDVTADLRIPSGSWQERELV